MVQRRILSSVCGSTEVKGRGENVLCAEKTPGGRGGGEGGGVWIGLGWVSEVRA